MDLDAVRTFVAVADAGQFQEAAAELSITQQAVSKRIAALEKDLGVRLFTRTARGAQLTIDGQAFLPHARELLRVAERAVASVRPGRRPLRVDVIAARGSRRRACCADFHRAHPEIELDVVMLFDVETADRRRPVRYDRRVPSAPSPIPAAAPRRHRVRPGARRAAPAAHRTRPRARRRPRRCTLAQLAGHRIWMPGIVPGTEWAAYYDELAAAFGLTIDAVGPQLRVRRAPRHDRRLPGPGDLRRRRLAVLWPARHDLRRIPVRDPTPVYPHSLLWRDDNPHPALVQLRDYLACRRADAPRTEVWTPRWH